MVPLAAQAQQLISGLATLTEQPSDLIFTTTGYSPVSGWSKTKQRLDQAMQVPPWRLHDLRRTTATGMADLGIDVVVIEACLNHISGARAGVAGIYNRAAYAEQKRAALTRWANHVANLVSGNVAKVTPLRKR